MMVNSTSIMAKRAAKQVMEVAMKSSKALFVHSISYNDFSEEFANDTGCYFCIFFYQPSVVGCWL